MSVVCMHQVDPHPNWKPMDNKMEFNAEAKRRLDEYSRESWQRHKRDPDFLKSVF
jgi:hypothetical protein